ncbi:aspartate aminotransferase family protein [Pseudomonadota bacterium]|nr:aspartate aminotransferase family protein [Pseudomonadota bacterium]
MNSQSKTKIMGNYQRLDVSFVKGDRVYLFDKKGRKYLDALSGIAVCGLGHAHPELVELLTNQAKDLWHTSNLYRIEHQEILAEILTESAKMDSVFFCNSGAEANEAAIKLCRKFGFDNGIKNPTIITMKGSFHGRTMATLSATGNEKVHHGFSPLLSGFKHVEFGNTDVLKSHLCNPDVVALMVEPIQGEGGIKLPPLNYLKKLRELCTHYRKILVLDEVQSGIGRTGFLFAHQLDDIVPDVLTLAKGLGNGIPVGACLVNNQYSGILGSGTHGSTFGGNPLVCKVALGVLKIINEKAFLGHVTNIGTLMLSEFRSRLNNIAIVKEIRGRGLMIGIELNKDCGELVKKALDRGLLINVASGNVVRLLPPLILSEDEGLKIVEEVTSLIESFNGNA